MDRKVILLLVVFSFVVAGVTGCAGQSESAKGKIGDPVGTAVANPGDPNPVGHSSK
jgi:hypothetical protein